MNDIPNFCLVRHSVGILIRQNNLGRKNHSPTSTEVLCEAEEKLRAAREILGKHVNKVPVA